MGRLFQNRAEPWMAEPSVHGRIHSVFWKSLPTRDHPKVCVCFKDYTNKNATNPAKGGGVLTNPKSTKG